MPRKPWGTRLGRRGCRISLRLPEQTRNPLSLRAQPVLRCEVTVPHHLSLKLWAGSVRGAEDAVGPCAPAGVDQTVFPDPGSEQMPDPVTVFGGYCSYPLNCLLPPNKDTRGPARAGFRCLLMRLATSGSKGTGKGYLKELKQTALGPIARKETGLRQETGTGKVERKQKALLSRALPVWSRLEVGSCPRVSSSVADAKMGATSWSWDQPGQSPQSLMGTAGKPTCLATNYFL